MSLNSISKEDNPLVSVCCLVYNHENYIQKTLEGFINQETDFKFEVLIHDDASSDKSAEIIKRYQNLYPDIIKPIFQHENQLSKGINVQRVYNYPRVKGKYVAFCEGDDFWNDNKKLQKQVDALEENSGCTISTHKTRKIKKNGEFTDSFFPPYEIKKSILTLEDYLNSEIKKSNWTFQLSSYVVRKEIIDLLSSNTIKFIDSFYRVGDFPLTILALTQGDMLYIDDEMSCYRMFSGGFMSNQSNFSNIDTRIKINDGFIKGYKEIDIYTHYSYHDIFEYGIKKVEFSNYIVKQNYKILTTPQYCEIYKELPLVKKIAVRIGQISPKLVKILLSIINKSF